MTETRTVTYEPDNSLKQGYFSIAKAIVLEFSENHWLMWQLFKRDFFSMYKQSFIGVFWVILMPIVNVATFLMLSQSGILNIGEISVPYPLFAILGMAYWQIFATGLLNCANSLSSAGDMIKRINFSRKSIVFASMGKSIVSFLIQFTLVVALFIFYRIAPHPAVVLLPLAILPLVLLTVGLGLLVALLNAIVRDIGNLLSVCLTLFMYLTPVLYAKPKMGVLSHFIKYNPLYYYISGARDLALSGQIHEFSGFMYSAIFSVVIFFLSLLVFHLTETRITERI